MNWLRRFRQWRAVMRLAGKQAKLLPMLRALLTGTVPRHVWRRRIRTCMKCPVYDRENLRCAATWNGQQLGCLCYVPFVAMTATPYSSDKGKGCWGRSVMGAPFGWGTILENEKKVS